MKNLTNELQQKVDKILSMENYCDDFARTVENKKTAKAFIEKMDADFAFVDFKEWIGAKKYEGQIKARYNNHVITFGIILRKTRGGVMAESFGYFVQNEVQL